MDRAREFETLAETVRKDLPGVAVRWLAAARAPLQELTMAALSGDVSDEEFLEMVEDFAKRLPGLMAEMDHDALGDHLEKAMGAAMGNGIAQGARRKDEG